MTTLRTVGKSIPRLEGVDKVQGRTKYAADLELPGMLWGKTLRSPHPHARIVHVDTSRARRIPGVHAVVTARDIPERLIGLLKWDMPVLARGKVRFIGERVAAVAAETPEIADEALLAIQVEYEELPAVFEALEAMEEGTPLVHEDPASYETPPRPAAGTPKFFRYMGTPLPLEPGTNVNSHVYWERNRRMRLGFNPPQMGPAAAPKLGYGGRSGPRSLATTAYRSQSGCFTQSSRRCHL